MFSPKLGLFVNSKTHVDNLIVSNIDWRHRIEIHPVSQRSTHLEIFCLGAALKTRTTAEHQTGSGPKHIPC